VRASADRLSRADTGVLVPSAVTLRRELEQQRALLDAACGSLDDSVTQAALNELWDQDGEARLIAALRKREASSDHIAYVRSLTRAWNAHYRAHREEIDRVQARCRQHAGRLLRRPIRRPGRARERGRAHGGRRAALRRSSARSQGRLADDPELAGPRGAV
jgi:hypothetical protein